MFVCSKVVRLFFAELFRLVESAQDHIRIETYILADAHMGQRLEAMLARAVARGVKVQVVVDGYGSLNITHSMALRLKHAGVELRVFRPDHKKLKPSTHRLRRLHRKIVVVDRSVAILGGINLVADDNHIDAGEENWMDHGGMIGPRYDFALRVAGPLVHDVWLAAEWLWWQIGPNGEVTDTLSTSWWRQRASDLGQIIQDSLALPLPDAAGGSRAMLVLRDNLRFRRDIEKAYLQALGKAQHEVWIANAYFLPGRKFRRALIQARKRGVKVHLLLQGLVQNALQHYATQALYDELLFHGIAVFEYTKSYLHAKVAVVDDHWCTVGSSNLDPFSLLLAREANVLVYDSKVVEQLRAELKHASQTEARPVTLQHMNNKSVFVRFMHKLAFMAVRLAVVLSGRVGRY